MFDSNDTVDIVLFDKPYQIKDQTKKWIRDFFSDTLAKNIVFKEINKDQLDKEILTQEELLKACKDYSGYIIRPTIFICVANEIKDSKALGFTINGSISNENCEDCKMALIVLSRDRSWLCSIFEKDLLKHELGHWLGVPGRDCHKSDDSLHCSDLRCIMINGPGTDKVRWMEALFLSLFLGPPDFCSNCKKELDVIKEMSISCYLEE